MAGAQSAQQRKERGRIAVGGAGRPHQCGRLGSLHKALWRKELAAMEAKNALAVEGALVGLHRFPPDAEGAVRWVNHMSIHPRPNGYESRGNPRGPGRGWPSKWWGATQSF